MRYSAKIDSVREKCKKDTECLVLGLRDEVRNKLK